MFPTLDPIKARPWLIASDDLTGPPVLHVQSRFSLAARFPSATPSKAWPPRNMGQPSAPAHPVDKARIKTGSTPFMWAGRTVLSAPFTGQAALSSAGRSPLLVI